MNVKKLILAIIVVGIVANVLDTITHAVILGPTYAANPGLFRQDVGMVWYFAGDFIVAIFFCLVFAKTIKCWGGGPMGGALYGLLVGLLVFIHPWWYNPLTYANHPYKVVWVTAVGGIIASVIMGIVVSMVYKEQGTK